jgi:hypothetical protein
MMGSIGERDLDLRPVESRRFEDECRPDSSVRS